MAFTKINAAGIGTTETVTVDGLTVINDGSFGGNLTVSGVLTYEDVTNVDSVGLITARNGIVVGSGITLSKDGDIFATGITTVSGNVKVGTGITLSPDGDGFYTGVVTATTFKGDGSQLTGVNSDVVDDTTPQLGGNLDVNTKNILFGDSGGASDDRLVFGAGTDMSLYHDGNNSVIENATGDLYIQNEAGNTSNQIFIRGKESTNSIVIHGNGPVVLYDQNTGSAVQRLTTTSTGVTISGNATFSGICTATGFSGTFSPRNMLINGEMVANQRVNGGQNVNSSSSKYPVDRWHSRGEGGKNFTVSQLAGASQGLGVRHYMRAEVTTHGSVGSNDIFNFRQNIEGYNVQRINLGESTCNSMALSFTVRSSLAGTHSGAIQNSAQNRSYPFTYTLTPNTWTNIKIIIPPITSGSFNETNGVGLRVVFDLGSGNNFRGTAGQWNSAQDEGATGAVRLIENASATWDITKIQLEEGTVCTPFEKKLYADVILSLIHI